MAGHSDTTVNGRRLATGSARRVSMADLRIHEAAASRPRYEGMGTTVVAAVIRDSVLSVAHVGDSRLYLYANGSLRQLIQDDTWLASVVAEGSDSAVFEYHPMRHALTNVLGGSKRAEVHMSERPLSGGGSVAAHERRHTRRARAVDPEARARLGRGPPGDGPRVGRHRHPLRQPRQLHGARRALSPRLGFPRRSRGRDRRGQSVLRALPVLPAEPPSFLLFSGMFL